MTWLGFDDFILFLPNRSGAQAPPFRFAPHSLTVSHLNVFCFLRDSGPGPVQTAD